MSDKERLAEYITTWRTSIDDFIAVLDGLEPEDWARSTDLVGWDVKAIASHTAHLESLLAGGPHETAEIGEAPHVKGSMGQFTEIGVVTRRDREPAAIVAEVRTNRDKRVAMLEAEPPADAAAAAPGVFGAIGWNMRTLLRNRPLDVWMHEQDIRRAVGRPGGMDSPGAQHTADYLSEAFGFVVGKRVAPPAGTTAVLEVAGSEPVSVQIGDDGRGVRLDAVPDDPTVCLAMGREAFIVLAGGRRAAEPGSVVVTGDDELGRRIIGQFATTP